MSETGVLSSSELPNVTAEDGDMERTIVVEEEECVLGFLGQNDLIQIGNVDFKKEFAFISQSYCLVTINLVWTDLDCWENDSNNRTGST